MSLSQRLKQILKDMPRGKHSEWDKYPGWAENDGLSYCMHVFLCARLRQHSEMLPVLEKWLLLHNDTCSQEYTQAWLDAVRSGYEAVAALALQKTDFGQVIRSCSPFCCLWDDEDDEERMVFLKKWWELRYAGVPIEERYAIMPKDGKHLVET